MGVALVDTGAGGWTQGVGEGLALEVGGGGVVVGAGARVVVGAAGGVVRGFDALTALLLTGLTTRSRSPAPGVVVILVVGGDAHGDAVTTMVSVVRASEIS